MPRRRLVSSSSSSPSPSSPSASDSSFAVSSSNDDDSSDEDRVGFNTRSGRKKTSVPKSKKTSGSSSKNKQQKAKNKSTNANPKKNKSNVNRNSNATSTCSSGTSFVNTSSTSGSITSSSGCTSSSSTSSSSTSSSSTSSCVTSTVGVRSTPLASVPMASVQAAPGGLTGSTSMSGSSSVYHSPDVLRSFINTFRLQELQGLMQFAGKGRNGRKSELQKRALDLLRLNNSDINAKIQELASVMYNSHASAPSIFNHMSAVRTASSIPATTINVPTNPSVSTAMSTATSGESNVMEPHQPRSKARRVASETTMPLSTGPSNYNAEALLRGIFPTMSSSSASLASFSTAHSSTSSSSTSSWTPHSSTSSSDMLPLHPDVRLKKLPFYKLLATLLMPSSLQPSKIVPRFQDEHFEFTLTPIQVEQVQETFGRGPETKKQIQLRFSLLETSCEQDDYFPPGLAVRVNNRIQHLPHPIPNAKFCGEPKIPPKPLNITPLCHLSATLKNTIDLSWRRDIPVPFTVSVYLVERLSPQDLLKELKIRGVRLADYTKALIKEKLGDRDNDLMTTSCKVTLACPLGKMRMTYPCRAHSCDHLQCFDANFYIMMNERKPKWLCPVCNKPALFDNLQIDAFFTGVLHSSKLDGDENDIVLSSDGSWEPLTKKKTEEEQPKKQKSEGASNESKNVVDIDDDAPLSVIASTSGCNSGRHKSAKKATAPLKRPISKFHCITLDSGSSDSDSNPPPVKRKSTHVDFHVQEAIPVVPNTVENNSGSDSPELICLDDDEDDNGQ